jgi:hypothetical protein
LHVSLFGDPTAVEEAQQSVKSLASELTTDESLTIPPSLELDIPALETKYPTKYCLRWYWSFFSLKRYDVKMELNKQTLKLKVYGVRESLSDLVEHIQSKINNTKTSSQVTFSRAHYLFIQKIILSGSTWQIMVYQQQYCC